MVTGNEQQAQYWAERAASWLEFEERIELVAAAPGRAAMDRLELRPGQTVLDLGCGAGRTTVELAGRVAPGGRATGIDIAEAMVGYARAQAGSAAAEFRQGDVQADDLGAGEYDAAFSRFGVMFFSDPVAAFANVRRALRQGGALSFACWQNVLANEWMLIPGMAIMSVTGALPTPPSPDEPGPFSLADPDRVRALLGAAGFEHVEVASYTDPVTLPAADIAGFAAQALTVGPVREALLEADADTRGRVRQAIEEAVTAKIEGDQARLARGVNLVLAR